MSNYGCYNNTIKELSDRLDRHDKSSKVLSEQKRAQLRKKRKKRR